jgi:hypothetical protein
MPTRPHPLFRLACGLPILLAALACPSEAAASELDACLKLVLQSWTRQERWVWDNVCRGRVADLATLHPGERNPDLVDKWPPGRAIRAQFIEQVLGSPLRANVIPARGFAIEHARIEPVLILQDIHFPRTLQITNSHLAGLDMNSSALRVLTLDGSHIVGYLDLNSVRATESLLMRRVTIRGSADLDHAHAGLIAIQHSTLDGKIGLNAARAPRGLFLTGTTAAFVDLTGAEIGYGFLNSLLVKDTENRFGDVELGDARVDGVLDLTGLQARTLNATNTSVRGNLRLSNARVEDAVFLGYARVDGNAELHSARAANLIANNLKVGGELVLDAAEITHVINFQSASVGADFLLRSAATHPPSAPAKARAAPGDVFQLSYATIAGNLDMSGSALRSVDMTGTTVGKDFRLGSASIPAPLWMPDAHLSLRNASAFSILDARGEVCTGAAGISCPDAWPAKIDLAGFTFRQFGATGATSQSDMSARDTDWWLAWLGRHEPFTPSPYQTVAKVLREHGHPDKADEILYAAKQRELEQLPAMDSALLFMQKLLIGYGYRIWYVWFWIFAFIAAGVAVLRISRQARRHRLGSGLAYSIDMLLPIIKLREAHYAIDLKGWARYYFFVHRTMGYVLATFLAAGLAGMTK